MQIIEVELDPGEAVVAGAGALNYMEDGINFETKMGDGSTPSASMLGSLLNVVKPVLTGESIVITHFSNSSVSKKRVAFAAPYPGKIIPKDLSSAGEDFILQRFSGDAKAFVNIGGTVIKRELNNEVLRVDTGSIAAFTPGIDNDIEPVG